MAVSYDIGKHEQEHARTLVLLCMLAVSDQKKKKKPSHHKKSLYSAMPEAQFKCHMQDNTFLATDTVKRGV